VVNPLVERSEDDFKKAVEIFEQHAADLLDMDLKTKGKTTRYKIHNLLSLGNDYANPFSLLMMADRLPAMLAFFGELRLGSERSLAAAEEEMELFIQEHWDEVLKESTLRVDAISDKDGKKLPAALKKAPTKDEVKNSLILKYRTKSDEIREKIRSSKQMVSRLSNVVDGLTSRIRLLNSQLQMVNTLTAQGIQKT